MELTFIITTAFILDLLLGDPKWFPHPVKGIGFLIKTLEPSIRKLIPSQKFAGLLFTITITGVCFSLSWFLLKIAYRFDLYFGYICSTILIYTTISIKDLKQHITPIESHLAKQNIDGARKALSMIVGRDTAHLEKEKIITATIESIAESTVDGILSPLFFSFIGGVPFAIAYKAVNTLDSLVGYKNKKYLHFGTASAKLDDILNFIPARLSLIIMSLASYISGQNGMQAFKIGIRDGKKHTSPNSGIPEAVMAGALKINLGGTSTYQGKTINKPIIGDNLKKISITDIPKSISIVYSSAIIALIIGILTRSFFIKIF